jgi:intracellular septation protein
MADKRPPPVWIRYAVDGAPAVAFLAVLLITHDFALATWFVVGGSVLALATGLIVERRIAPVPAFSGGLALLFGGASLWLHRADILQMKMTIVDGVLGAVLFGGLVMKKNPLKALLGGAFDLPDSAWRTLAVRYGLFWWGCGIANELVRRNLSAVIWGEFRLAVMIAAVVFALAQTPFIMRHNRIDRTGKVPEPPESGL